MSVERRFQIFDIRNLRREIIRGFQPLFGNTEVVDTSPDGCISRPLICERVKTKFLDPNQNEVFTLIVESWMSTEDVNFRDAYHLCCATNSFPHDPLLVTPDYVPDFTLLNPASCTQAYQTRMCHFAFDNRKSLLRNFKQTMKAFLAQQDR